MTAAVSIPITVTSEASEYIEGLGMRPQFEQMLEHTRRTVPGLNSISVELDPDPSNTIGPGIVIWAHRDRFSGAGVDGEWGRWQVMTFPPEVCLQFVMLSVYDGENHGR